jgi:iron-sulfur cluster assembly protein
LPGGPDWPALSSLSRRQWGRLISHPAVTYRSEVLSVLTLTDRAADTIRALTSQPGVPPDAGLRMSMQGSDDGRLALTLEGRQPDDAVIEDAGARVYVQQDAASVVEDRQLDAQLDDEGRASFVLSDPS